MRSLDPARFACTLAFLACVASPCATAASPPVSGEGVVITGYDADFNETTRVFKPTHGIAVRTTKPDRVWLLLTERDASMLEWAGSADRIDVLQAWCKSQDAAYVLFELGAEGVPELVHECAGKVVNTAMISSTNGLASVVPTWEAFGPDRLRGGIRSGKGSCGDGVHCEVTGTYTFDVPIASAPSAK
jgi:hypothetical protein